MNIIFARLFNRYLTGDVDRDTYSEKLIQAEIKRIKLLANFFLILAYASVISFIIIALIGHFNPSSHIFDDVPLFDNAFYFRMTLLSIGDIFQIIFLHLFKANLLMLKQPHKRRHITYAALYVTSLLPLLLIFVDINIALAQSAFVLANACLFSALYLTQRQSLHVK